MHVHIDALVNAQVKLELFAHFVGNLEDLRTVRNICRERESERERKRQRKRERESTGKAFQE